MMRLGFVEELDRWLLERSDGEFFGGSGVWTFNDYMSWR
jgi:hypothetical protein